MSHSAPSLSPAAPESRGQRSPTRPVGEPNRRVLIVDDSPDVAGDFRKILGVRAAAASDLEALESRLFGPTPSSRATPSFELEFATQGQEALARVVSAVQSERPYALIFMDVRMPPGWDGIETTSRVLTEDPEVGVVLCTAYSDHSWQQMSDRFGPTDRVLVLKKPFDPIEVRQLAHALQRRWELSRLANLKRDALEDLVEDRTRDLQDALQQLRDETRRREESESQLRLSQKLDAIGHLAAGIAHEVNTPLQYIGDHVDYLNSAFADLQALLGHYRDNGHDGATRVSADRQLDEKQLLEQVPRALAQTQYGIERIAAIVRAMREFSHPDGVAKEPHDLHRLLDNTLTVAAAAYNRLADLDVVLGELPRVLCHGGAVSQVLLNLLLNAAHAIEDAVGNTGERGVIRIVTTMEGDDTVLLSVSDTGVGIGADIGERIFDPFFTTKAVGRGSGQGLTLSRAVVVGGHGGTLTFESRLGEGATFFMRLPVGPGRAPA